ncbi:MAG TPA: hypothetical protein PK648_02600 [Verrucomicrobiales bacterium]|nr:hypothetical protein [Verrucomicrobiales bacterium]
MNRATQPMRAFAERLIAHEADSRSSDQGPLAAFTVPDRMRSHLTMLMGSGGHRALLMRALALAGEEVPWLHDSRVAPEGNLQRPDLFEESVDPVERSEGGIVLVAQLIGLLVAFIGEWMTLRLVSEIWPKLREYVITDQGVVVIEPRQTDYAGLTTGIPTRQGRRDDPSPEPKATS